MNDQVVLPDGVKVQAATQPGGAVMNEDVLVVNPHAHIYGVIDGVSSLVKYEDEEGRTGGCIAAWLLAHELQAEWVDIDLGTAVLKANVELRRCMQSEGIDVTDKGKLWGAVFALVKVYEKHIEFVQSGDCMLFAKYSDGSIRVMTRNQVAGFDLLTLNARRNMIESGTMTDDEINAAMHPLYEANRNLANTLEGYSVMNGDPELEHFMESGSISRAGIVEIYAVTDGLFHFIENAEDPYKWERFVSRLDELGIEPYFARLAAEESLDPLCRKYPRHKKSDDKTAIILTL